MVLLNTKSVLWALEGVGVHFTKVALSISLANEAELLTLSQTTNFRLFQIQSLWRRQF